MGRFSCFSAPRADRSTWSVRREQREGGVRTVFDREDVRLKRVMLRHLFEPEDHGLARGEGVLDLRASPARRAHAQAAPEEKETPSSGVSKADSERSWLWSTAASSCRTRSASSPVSRS